MRLKDNTVQIQGLRVEMLFAILVADQVYLKYGYEFVITSINDGVHSLTSLHYNGCAIDCRIYDNPGEMEAIAEEIKERLGVDYDVILEHNHIHIEYQPRKR